MASEALASGAAVRARCQCEWLIAAATVMALLVLQGKGADWNRAKLNSVVPSLRLRVGN